VMPEALEKWPVAVIGKLLPRHLEIIDKIDTIWKDSLKARTQTGYWWGVGGRNGMDRPWGAWRAWRALMLLRTVHLLSPAGLGQWLVRQLPQ